MPPADKHLAATVYAAVHAAVADAINVHAPPGVVAARATSAALAVIGDDQQPRERPAERRRRENAAMLAKMDELKRQGMRRGAATAAAKCVAVDPDDPLEVEMLAQRARRLCRNKNEQCSDGRENDE
jgi:hypothetical protein